MRRTGAVALALAVAVAAAGCARASAGATGSGAFPADRRVAAPDLRADLLDGGSYELAKHHGEVVVINFWASWCSPCRDEAPELQAAYAATKDSNVSFLGINVRDERDRAKAFEEVSKVGYPSVFDPPGQYALDFKVPPTTLPTTLVVDRQGRIAAVYRKALLRDDLIPAISAIAAER
jgi:thiol-disulfide isomerase/thioredoxin